MCHILNPNQSCSLWFCISLSQSLKPPSHERPRPVGESAQPVCSMLLLGWKTGRGQDPGQGNPPAPITQVPLSCPQFPGELGTLPPYPAPSSASAKQLAPLTPTSWLKPAQGSRLTHCWHSRDSTAVMSCLTSLHCHCHTTPPCASCLAALGQATPSQDQNST